MAKKDNSAIVAADTSNYIVTTESDIMELIEENLEGDELSAFDLGRVVNPQGKAGAWTIPTPRGDELENEVEGVIIFHKKKRAYWPDPKVTNTRPQCSSLDGKTGVGDPGGKCKECAFAQFGTKINKDGEVTRGQACAARKHVFIVRENDLFPLFFSLPPTALKPMKTYLAGLTSERLRYHRVVTRIKLEKRVNAEGTEFYAPVFEMVGALDDESWDSILSYRDMVVPWLEGIQMDASEEEEEPDFD